MKINIAPSPAPAEIPSNPGSARLFLSIHCKTIPEHESDDPTSIVFKTLGSLMSSKIFLSVTSVEENMFIISPNEIDTLPSDSERRKLSNNAAVKAVNINTFLDNN